MLNHGSTSQCVFLADKFKHNYVVKANTTVKEGDQALVTYGAHSNARLWYFYGFRLTDNIYNKVTIPYGLNFQYNKDHSFRFIIPAGSRYWAEYHRR